MKKWRKHNTIAAVVLGAVVVFGVLATKRTAEDTSPPSVPAAVDQRAVNALLALPELKAWSDTIEKNSGGRARGAVIGGDAEPKTIDGVTYHAYSFMENDPEQAKRLQGFYATPDGARILVEDPVTGDTMTVEQWRQTAK